LPCGSQSGRVVRENSEHGSVRLPTSRGKTF
jgi:hypothetical protein